MNAVTRALLGLAAMAALALAAWYGYQAAAAWPIRAVHFTGDVSRIAADDLERFAQSVRGMPSGAATLAAVREAARRIAWVREASVRRRFPDALEVHFESHAPFARWNDHALVSTAGEVFVAPYGATLPRFSGPEGSAAEMTREYPRIVRALAPAALTVAEVKLSPRGAWQVVLDSGLTLELGRTELVERLGRFAAAWPRIAPEAPVSADLRYPNGFALRLAAARATKS